MESQMSDEIKNFWQTWTIKDVIQLAIILIGFILNYVKLVDRVETNKLLIDAEIITIKESVKASKNQRDKDFDLLISTLNRINDKK